MRTRTIITLAVGGVAALAIAGTAVAGQLIGDADTPITGEALERATEAALAHTGGGTVTGTEVGDEDSYYEVEVTLDSGAQVDVQLDESFLVVDVHPDADETGDDDSDADG